jgi:hypothetical protein
VVSIIAMADQPFHFVCASALAVVISTYSIHPHDVGCGHGSLPSESALVYDHFVIPVRQATQYYCGPACLESIFRDAWPWGPILQHEIVQRGIPHINANGSWGYANNLQPLLDKVVGLIVPVHAEQDLGKLQQRIDDGNFVLLFLHNKMDDGLHIVRYGGGNLPNGPVEVMEPAFGQNETWDAARISLHNIDARFFKLPDDATKETSAAP